MSKNTATLMDFDPVEFLDDAESIQAYIDEAVETGDAARAKGMTDLAEKTGLSRETLYRTLSSKGNPNLKTLIAITSALGVSVKIGTSA